MKPWPNFHEAGLQPMLRAAKLRNATEHPEAREHIADFERLLQEPFTGMHSTAAEALLKMHDENNGDRAPITALAKAYGCLLTKHAAIKDRPLPVQHFLERIGEELRIRNQKVEKIGELRYHAPLPVKKEQSEQKLKLKVRQLLSLRSQSIVEGHTHGHFVEKSINIAAKVECLEIAIAMSFNHKSVNRPRLKAIAAPAHLADKVRATIQDAGFNVKKEQTGTGGVYFELEATPTLLKILKEYKVKE